MGVAGAGLGGDDRSGSRSAGGDDGGEHSWSGVEGTSKWGLNCCACCC